MSYNILPFSESELKHFPLFVNVSYRNAQALLRTDLNCFGPTSMLLRTDLNASRGMESPLNPNSSAFLLSSLELSDAHVYEPYIRALLGP